MKNTASVKLLDNTNTVEDGDEQQINSSSSNFTIQAVVIGTVTACTVYIKGRLLDAPSDKHGTLATYAFTAQNITDETAVFHIAGRPVDFADETAVFHIAGRPVDFVLAGIDSITGGGTIDLFLKAN